MAFTIPCAEKIDCVETIPLEGMSSYTADFDPPFLTGYARNREPLGGDCAEFTGAGPSGGYSQSDANESAAQNVDCLPATPPEYPPDRGQTIRPILTEGGENFETESGEIFILE